MLVPPRSMPTIGLVIVKVPASLNGECELYQLSQRDGGMLEIIEIGSDLK